MSRPSFIKNVVDLQAIYVLCAAIAATALALFLFLNRDNTPPQEALPEDSVGRMSSPKQPNQTPSETIAQQPVTAENRTTLRLEFADFHGLNLVNGVHLNIRGNDLGPIDLVLLESDPDAAIVDYLVSLSDLTNMRDRLEIATVKVRSKPDGSQSVQFRQVIDGIPVDSSFRLDVDSYGIVKDLEVLLLKPDRVDRFSIDQRAAKRAAAEKISETFGVNSDELVFAGTSGGARVVPTDGLAAQHYKLASGVAPVGVKGIPIWKITYFVSEPARAFGVHRVTIDGATGAAEMKKTHFL